MTYSQVGQDRWVLAFFPAGYKGTFVDVGAFEPHFLSNTLLLEEKGWRGIAIDNADYSQLWKQRVTPFIITNALNCNYNELLQGFPLVIDYLSLDIEGDGDRFTALKNVIESNYQFKIITVEHDVYRGYDKTERLPQRSLLLSKGYTLVYPDVEVEGKPFEDWWINYSLL